MSVQSIEIIYENDFRKGVRGFPRGIQEKLANLIDILRHNAFDPRLHTKPLGSPLQGLFTFRITRNYRVAFEFSNPNAIRLIIADTRNNIYRRLRRKQ